MEIAELSMKPLANYLAVTHKDSSNKRIRAHAPATALRQLKGPLQMSPIRGGKLGIHR
jgi:hypothetical protein